MLIKMAISGNCRTIDHEILFLDSNVRHENFNLHELSNHTICKDAKG